MGEWEIIAPGVGRIYFTVAVAGSVAWKSKKECKVDKVPNAGGGRLLRSLLVYRRVALADFLDGPPRFLVGQYNWPLHTASSYN